MMGFRIVVLEDKVSSCGTLLVLRLELFGVLGQAVKRFYNVSVGLLIGLQFVIHEQEAGAFIPNAHIRVIMFVFFLISCR